MTNPHASLVRVFRLVRTAECFTTVRKLRLSTRMTGGQWTSFICSGWATEEPLRRQPGRISRCWQNDFSRTTAFFQPSSLASLAITWRHQHHVGGRVQCPEQHQWQIEQSGCGARRRGLHPFIETRWLRDSDLASSGTGRSARALATTGEGRSRGALPPTHRKGSRHDIRLASRFCHRAQHGCFCLDISSFHSQRGPVHARRRDALAQRAGAHAKRRDGAV